MRNILRFGLVILFGIILYACNIGRSPTATPNNAAAVLPALTLTVQAQNANSPTNAVGQTITFAYTLTNSGTTSLAGPVTINDPNITPTVSCPPLNTVGTNKDNN